MKKTDRKECLFLESQLCKQNDKKLDANCRLAKEQNNNSTNKQETYMKQRNITLCKDQPSKHGPSQERAKTTENTWQMQCA